MSDKTLREIEQAIDQWPLDNSPLLKEPLPYAIFYLLTAHEHACETFGVLGAGGRGFSDMFLDDAKYGLMYALLWAHSCCGIHPDFRPPVTMNKGRLKSAIELLKIGIEYQGVVASFTTYSRDLAQAEVIDTHTIRFKSNALELQLTALDRMIAVERGLKTKINVFEKMRQDEKSQRILRRIMDSARIHCGAQIKYDYNKSDIESLRPLMRETLEPTFVLPDGWSFRGIGVADFRNFWSIVSTMAMIHTMCHVRMLEGGYLPTGSTSYVMHSTATSLVESIHQSASELAKDDIEHILQLLTYDHQLNKPDPALQPFIISPPENLLLPPQLFLGSRHERNLMSLLSRNYSDEYSATTDILEEQMTRDLEVVARGDKFQVVTRRTVAGDSRLPDIDLAIYDSSTNILLLAELKWVIPPSEVYEVYERATAEEKGISQMRTLLAIANEEPEKIWNSCFGKTRYPKELSVFGCVVMRGFTGTAQNYDEEVPVIEESILREKLSETTRLDELVDWLLSRAFLPVIGKDIDIAERPCEIGPYKILWSAYKLLD